MGRRSLFQSVHKAASNSKRHRHIAGQVRAISLYSRLQYERKSESDRHLSWSYCHGPGQLPFMGDTVGEALLKTVERYPDVRCLTFCEDEVRRTFQQFMQEVDQLAASLHSLGFKRGDCIGIWGPSTLEWVVTQFASARIGAILVNVNPAYQIRELEFALNKTKLKGIISAVTYKTQKYYEMLTQLAPELSSCDAGKLKSKKLPHLSTVIMMGAKAFPGAYAFDDVMKIGSTKDISEIQNISRMLDFDDPINIQFTSGTTGNPKGATLSHHNIINNIRYIGRRLGYGDYHHKILCQVPLYHCFGMVGGPLAMSVYGSSIVFPCAGYDPALTLKAIDQEKCNVVYGTPTMYIDMISQPDFNKHDYTTMEKGIMAGSSCPAEVVQKSDTAFGAKIMVAYGTTENSPVTFMTYLDDSDDMRTQTVGMPAPFTEAKIVNEAGEIVPVNTPGELLIRGYCVMQGYWESEDKTAEAITKEGWYRTGDIATLDGKGYGRIVGRTKDLIIRGGENIYPAEVEDILHTMDKIDNVQIFGVPDKRLGEEVAAWISLKAGEEATPDDIKSFCKGKMAHYKIPKHIKFVEEFPLTVTRKVQKFKMREDYSKELGISE
uniref:medium-chain acyl-CoA ligase ACSF2, mitochondrial-like n=1 Tax=Styela clava TaxID=7725 RepID=UPI00193AC585|nr:medium-chain acyl-CoA ligase ACSF2, mitochondrial-like [Styela clava]